MKIINQNTLSHCCKAMTYTAIGSNIVKCGKCHAPQIRRKKYKSVFSSVLFIVFLFLSLNLNAQDITGAVYHSENTVIFPVYNLENSFVVHSTKEITIEDINVLRKIKGIEHITFDAQARYHFTFEVGRMFNYEEKAVVIGQLYDRLKVQQLKEVRL